jgi:hypothetical protein
MADLPGFSNRKFSINRNTGVPRPARRFSSGEPGLNGMSYEDVSAIITPANHILDLFQRRAVRFIASFEPPTRGMTALRLSFSLES